MTIWTWGGPAREACEFLNFFSIELECARAGCAADKLEAPPPSIRWRKRLSHGSKGVNIMKFGNMQHGTQGESDVGREEQTNGAGWLAFHGVAFCTAILHWLKFRRICAWHQPRPRCMGGNPLARQITHGICPECFARVSGEIISHGETGLRVSVTKAGHQGGASLPAPPARNCAVPAGLQRPAAGDMDTFRTAILRGKPFHTQSTINQQRTL
jgi:hypothetical protein